MRLFWHFYALTFKRIIRNSSVFTTLVLSVVFYSFFYPAAYQSQHAEHLPVVIVDEAPNTLSTAIINTLERNPSVQLVAVVSNFSEAETLIKRQQADAIVYLPRHLSQSLRGGETGGIGLYLSTAYFLRTQTIVQGVASSMLDVVRQHLQQFGQISHFQAQDLLHRLPLYNNLAGYGSYIFPAVAPLIIHQTILLGLGMLVAGWREQGWRPQRGELAAIFASILTIGCLGCAYLFGFTLWFNDYPRGGNFAAMVLAVPIFVACVTSLSLLVASFLDMAERSGHVLVFTSVPLFLLSGVAWPTQAMPTWLQTVSACLPSTVGINTMVQINQMGASLSDVANQLAYLALCSVVFGAWAWWRLQQPRPTPASGL